MSHDRYSKFIRGKDLSSKSAQDLSCVLGKRRRRRKGGSSNKEGEEGQGEDKVSEGASRHERDTSQTDRQTDRHMLVACSLGEMECSVYNSGDNSHNFLCTCTIYLASISTFPHPVHLEV